MSDLLSADRLIFDQKAKVVEMNIDFAVRDDEGNEIGRVRQEGQSQLKKLARLVSSLDQFMTHTLGVFDASGAKVVELTRPRKVFKSTVLVKDGSGAEVGKIVQENMVGKIHFGLQDAQGRSLGAIRAENWRAWNFSIQDPAGAEVGRITKTWEGLAKTVFTTADDYLLEISAPVSPSLRKLMLASAAGIDLALKQDARGLN
ncbi:MAG TPA: phospholipid scramblase-related protein [Actinomycetota bacterium]